MRHLLGDLWEVGGTTRERRIMFFVYALILPTMLLAVAVYSIIQRSRINELAKDIQANRIEVTRQTCEEQNARNTMTIASLDHLVGLVPADEREAARAARVYTILLINALLPVRDCDQVVAELYVR